MKFNLCCELETEGEQLTVAALQFIRAAATSKRGKLQKDGSSEVLKITLVTNRTVTVSRKPIHSPISRSWTGVSQIYHPQRIWTELVSNATLKLCAAAALQETVPRISFYSCASSCARKQNIKLRSVAPHVPKELQGKEECAI